MKGKGFSNSALRIPHSALAKICSYETVWKFLIGEMLDGQILLGEAMAEFEKIYIQKALKRNDEHLSKTANALGIHRNTLSKRVNDYQAAPKSPKRLLARRAKQT